MAKGRIEFFKIFGPYVPSFHESYGVPRGWMGSEDDDSMHSPFVKASRPSLSWFWNKKAEILGTWTFGEMAPHLIVEELWCPKLQELCA